MGLGRHAVEAIAREHMHRKVDGDVLMIGRQTVYFSGEDLLSVLREVGVDLKGVDPNTIEVDKETIDRRAKHASRALVSDRGLFRALGARSVLALDHSAYEGAEVIHDLRYPLPQALNGIADFIVDGSTLDNVFTPSVTLANYAALLRPGGRLIAINAFSAHDTPYAIMPPLWYVDYFVMNGFADCKVYIIAWDQNRDNVFYVDLDFLRSAKRQMGRFHSPFHMATLVMAERGEQATTDRLPNQQDYRSEAEWDIYLRNLDRMLTSKRHHLARSRHPQFYTDPVGGHRYVDSSFAAR